MPTKEDLLWSLTVKELRQLAKMNRISLVIEGWFSDKYASRKEDIIDVLLESPRITRKKIQAIIEPSPRPKPKPEKELKTPEERVTKAKKRGKRAYKKGAELERRVARWLRSQFGYECERRELVRGKFAKRPYEVDIHASCNDTDLWVESKAYRVKRNHVNKLVESARDVRDATKDDIEEWYPDMLMLVSNKGFDVDAIGMADKYCIYCVKAGKTYEFVGEMTREDFENEESSEY